MTAPAGLHRKTAGRRRPGALLMLASGLLAACCGAGGLALSALTWNPVPRVAPAARVAAPRGLAETAPPPGGGTTPARPVSLVIPAIGVRTRLIRLGLSRAGTLQVPGSTAVAGWYDGSPRPGAIGSSVIAGHVDSYAGPGVFFELRELRPGDRVYVRRADGTLAVFTVTSIRRYLKDRFPTAAVYGPAPGAQLRLITCGGTFDYATRTYLANVVVYATLLS